MSYYEPEPLTDLKREFLKIAAQLRVHADAITGMSARIQALEARPVVAPNPPPAPIAPSADVLWRWNADQIAPFGIHAKDPSRVTLVNVGGRPGVRLLTIPGDNNVNGSMENERCDLRLGNAESDAKEGREWWCKYSVWFPDDYVQPPQSPLSGGWNWMDLLNWHDDADIPGIISPLELLVYPVTAVSPDRPTGLTVRIHGDPPGSTTPRAVFAITPIMRNRWYDFMYRIRWTSTSAGFADGWLDGKQFMAYKGPTLYTGHGAYLKLANYHSPHGKPSAVVHGAMIHAKTQAALA